MTSDSTTQAWFDLEPSLLRVFQQPSMEKWAALGPTFQAMGIHRQWWLGDWALLGEQIFGEACFQEVGEELERETGYSYHTVRVAAWVASKFPPSDRVADVSWRHHKEVAAIVNRDRRRQLLQEARDQDWTIARLRREVKRYRDGDACGDPNTKTALRIIDGTWADMLKVLVYERFDLLVADVRRDDPPVDTWLPPALQLLGQRVERFPIGYYVDRNSRSGAPRSGETSRRRELVAGTEGAILAVLGICSPALTRRLQSNEGDATQADSAEARQAVATEGSSPWDAPAGSDLVSGSTRCPSHGEP